MTQNFYKLGMSLPQIEELEATEGKMKEKVKRQLVALHESNPLTPSELEEFEKEIGFKLPLEYRDFLLSRNGARVSNYIFDTKTNQRVLDCFFATNGPKGAPEHIDITLSVYENRYPSVMFPIASAGGGDLILIGCKDENYGKIFYWDHNYEAEDDGSNYYDNIEEVADSFSDFIAMLHD